MLRFSIFSKVECPWHHESLNYHARRNRHKDSLDPNNFDLNKLYNSRDGVGKVRVGEAPKPLTAKERRCRH